MNVLGLLVLTEAVCVLRCWCIKLAWAWFLVPLGIRPIGVAWAWGIFHLLAMLRPFPKPDDGPDKVTALLAHAAATMVLLGSAWLGHWVMR